MGLSQGQDLVKTTLVYDEQHSEVTAAALPLFRLWHDLAAKKMEEAQMQIPTIDFLKEILHLHIYFMINTIFT
jgi:hypothetical protein